MLKAKGVNWGDIGRFILGAAALLLGIALGAPDLLRPPPANAYAPKSCLSNDDPERGVGAIEEPGETYSNDSRGTRGSVHIGGQIWCQRISSVYLSSPDFTRQIEVGYVVGWSNGYCEENGEPHWYGSPRVFVHRDAGFGSTIKCNVYESLQPVAGQYDTFRVSATEAPGEWHAFFQGNDIRPDGWNLGFQKGWNTVGRERGEYDDPGFAHFKEMEEHHDSNGWTRWNGMSGEDFEIGGQPMHLDNDAFYNLNVVDTDNGKVECIIFFPCP